MHKSIDIKKINIKDNYLIISQFMHKLHINEYNLFKKTAFWEEIEQSYMRHVIQMQEECEGVCLVAYENDEPIGFIFGYLNEQDESRIEVYTGKELYVSDGFVEESFRRHGVYNKLNEYLEQYYISLGVRRIIRYTLINNLGMRQFLENNDYAITRLQYEKWLD